MQNEVSNSKISLASWLLLTLFLATGCGTPPQIETRWLGEKIRYKSPSVIGIPQLAKEVKADVTSEEFLRNTWRQLTQEWKWWSQKTQQSIAFKPKEIDMEEFFFGQRTEKKEGHTERAKFQGGVTVLYDKANPQEISLILELKYLVNDQQSLPANYLFNLMRNRIVSRLAESLDKRAQKKGIALKLKDLGVVPNYILPHDLGQRAMAKPTSGKKKSPSPGKPKDKNKDKDKDKK